jgi:glycine betaine/choline ABC-type transport system substrate-binding protein
LTHSDWLLTGRPPLLPPYDAVPIVRQTALQKFPSYALRSPTSPEKSPLTKCAASNRQVDADQLDVAVVVREFRTAKGL